MKIFLTKLVGWLKRNRVPVVLQAEMLECAHACLSMISCYHGKKVTLERLRMNFEPSSRGTSVSHLVRMSQALGMNARIFRAEPNHLSQLKLPCILHWDVVHFVVLESCGDGRFGIIDPAVGHLEVGEAELNRRFTGIAVELTPGTDFYRETEKSESGALDLLREGLAQYKLTFGAVILLALVLEGLALVSPLFIQVVTDSILPSGDSALLLILGCAFAASALLQTAISLSRSSLLIRLGEELTVGWNAAVCSRLLRLPYVFFVRRSIGDINSRFDSIAEVQRAVTHRFVESALDGATAMLSLGIILFYSPALAVLTLCFSIGYGVFRVVTLPRLVQTTERSIRLQSSQQALLLEILHGIHSIKANGHEPTKLARYNRKTRDAARAAMSVQQFSGVVDEIGQTILRLHWIAAVAVGASLVMKGRITAGMLVAYVTYAYQFSVRSTRLLDVASEWRMLLLHCARLSDIVSSPEESRGGTEMSEPDRNDLSVHGLQFRYDADGPRILHDVSLNISSGECVALKGPSGSGKSTLAKLIIGLLEPDEGEIRIGGKSIDEIRRKDLRDKIACVLQDDQLFNGTIAENIAFFEPGFSRDDVVDAAKMAQIHNEIMLMPLRYDSRIIDLGASLSGGQRQRLILARALYRKPSILILDEASSHLDLANEHLVNQAISSLKITRIIIAHRPETLAIADRVFELRNGSLAADVHSKEGFSSEDELEEGTPSGQAYALSAS